MKIQKRKGKCKQVLAILILGIVCMMSGRMQGGVVQAATEGDFIYSVNEDETTVTITEYTGEIIEHMQIKFESCYKCSL